MNKKEQYVFDNIICIEESNSVVIRYMRNLLRDSFIISMSIFSVIFMLPIILNKFPLNNSFFSFIVIDIFIFIAIILRIIKIKKFKINITKDEIEITRKFTVDRIKDFKKFEIEKIYYSGSTTIIENRGGFVYILKVILIDNKSVEFFRISEDDLDIDKLQSLCNRLNTKFK